MILDMLQEIIPLLLWILLRWMKSNEIENLVLKPCSDVRFFCFLKYTPPRPSPKEREQKLHSKYDCF
jgi:hypothetical protein